ncbi:MAG: hypothetical protein NVS1B5_16800 [Gemmatimonadaceae bacterium]
MGSRSQVELPGMQVAARVGLKKRTKHDALMCEAILGVSAQRVSAPKSKLRK